MVQSGVLLPVEKQFLDLGVRPVQIVVVGDRGLFPSFRSIDGAEYAADICNPIMPVCGHPIPVLRLSRVIGRVHTTAVWPFSVRARILPMLSPIGGVEQAPG